VSAAVRPDLARSITANAAAMGLLLIGYALLPSAALALLAAVGFAALACRSPQLGLAAVVATLPTYLYPREMAGLALSLPETALLLTTVATIVRAIVRRDVVPRGSPFDPWVALLLASALLSLLPTEYLKLSLRSLRTLILEPVLFFYLTLMLVPSLAALRPLVWSLLGSASVVSAIAIAQVLGNIHTVEVEGARRALGTYFSPNHLGLFLGRAFPFALALSLWVPRWRPWALLIAALIALAIGATFSAGAWLGAAASLLVLAAFWGPRALVATALSGGALAAVGMLTFAALGIERVTGQFSRTGETANFRRQIWTSALAMVRDHPLLGIGLDNFLYRYQLEYILPAAWQEPNISHPHNWALQFWLELGVPGLVAAVGLLGSFFWLALRRLRRAPSGENRALVAGAVASMGGLLVHGSLDNSYFLVDLAILFWLHLAVIVIATREPPESLPSGQPGPPLLATTSR
jgi:O-antigen ligase